MVSCSASRGIDNAFKKSTAFNSGFTGLAVFDPDSGRMLYERSAGKYFTPASNIKLFTFYAGLRILGDSVPGLQYVITNDSLIFSGTGDPTFLNPDFKTNTVYNFLKQRREQLYYVPAENMEKHFGPGWAWDDFSYYFSAERAAFPIYGNRVYFNISPDHKLKVTPSVFKDSVRTVSSTSEGSSFVKRDQAKNKFFYLKEEKSQDFQRQIPFRYSPELFKKLLSDTLNKVVGQVASFPEGADRTILLSTSTDSLYKRMLQESDNFVAEQLLLLCSHKISDSLHTETAIEHVRRNFLQELPDQPVWVDGSGLSRYNLVTPRSVVFLLQKIMDELPPDKLFPLMAAGGRSGTLRNSYKAAEPFIFAKTGTLRNNHSLSGYIRTKKGKILAFSFMNNNYTIPTSEIKEQMEHILRLVHQKF